MTHTHLYAQREMALMELSKKREVFPDLAPILWHTVGTMAALLQVGKWERGNHWMWLGCGR